MPLTAYNREHQEWESNIGKAILWFGEIELILFKCFEIFPTNKSTNELLDLKFNQRVNLLVNTLKRSTDKAEYIQGLIEKFTKSKNLANTRNLIAHNPLMLDIYGNDEMDQYYIERAIRSTRKNDVIFRIEDLKEFVAEIENMKTELWILLFNVRKSTEDIYRRH